MCKTRAEAEAALASLRQILGELGLELKDAKTQIVHLTEGGEGVDFLGFHHRWVRANTRQACPVPRPLALTPGDAARPRPCSRDHGARAAAAPRRGDRAGPQRVPARVGGLLPLRKLRPPLQPDRAPRAQPARAVHGQTPPTVAGVRLAASHLPLARPLGLGQPRWNHRRAQASPGLARVKPNAGGEERRRAVCGKTACTEYARHDQQLGGASPLWRLMAPTTSRWQLLSREAGWEGSRSAKSRP